MLWWADDRYEYSIHFCDIFPLGPRLSLKAGEEQRTRAVRMNMCMMVNKNNHFLKYVLSRKIFYKYFRTYYLKNVLASMKRIIAFVNNGFTWKTTLFFYMFHIIQNLFNIKPHFWFACHKTINDKKSFFHFEFYIMH